jgi:hypothetical protein
VLKRGVRLQRILFGGKKLHIFIIREKEWKIFSKNGNLTLRLLMSYI